MPFTGIGGFSGPNSFKPNNKGPWVDDVQAWGQPHGYGPRFVISGVTRDSHNNALGNCTVVLYRTRDDSFVDVTVSDGSGNYIFPNVTPQDQYFVVAYLAGTPDVSGTTLNTLVGTQVN